MSLSIIRNKLRRLFNPVNPYRRAMVIERSEVEYAELYHLAIDLRISLMSGEKFELALAKYEHHVKRYVWLVNLFLRTDTSKIFRSE